MKTWALAGLVAWGALGPAFSQSQSAPASHIYTCRDASGHILTSDRPIPECSDRAMEERSKGGVLLREIAPPLTAAQQRQAEADEKKRRELEETQREQQRRDRVLLSTYSNEKEIDGARSRAVSDFKEALDAANGRLAGLNQEHAANERDLAALKGKPVPYELQRRIDLNESAIASEKQTIADRQNDIDRINKRFDADLERFHTLTRGIAKE
jgi:hypothetical protein